MGQNSEGLRLQTLERKRVEKFRKRERDARIHRRLSALLWLDKGHSVQQVAELLDVCPRTVRDWVALYQDKGLETLCSLEYQGDPG
jgi:transposase